MKLASLHLRAYGPFTNVVLPFEEHPAGLQIVFGPNEAGKSSALRAVGAFLFGISNQTTDAFLHEYGSLRIGAVLLGENGKRHALMRRKGNKNVLFAFDEASGEERSDRALGSDYIAQLLPGLDDKLFESLFGLSHERLRTGGQALIAGEGDLGSAIFAAGSGLSGVRGVTAELDETARALFLAGGKNAKINIALREHENSRTQFREALVRPRAWKDLDERFMAETKALKMLEAEEQRLRGEASHQQRLIDLRPRAVKRQNLLRELTELDGIVKLPDDVRTRSTSAQERLNAASETISAASANIETNTRVLEGIVVSEPHIRAAAEIEALHHQADAAREAYEQLTTLAAAIAHQKETIAALVVDLDPTYSVEKAADLVPPTAVVTRLRLFCRQFAETDTTRIAAEERAEEARQELADVLERLKTIPEPGDASALEAALEDLQRQGDLERTLASAQSKRAAIADEVKRLCSALEHPSEETLFSLPIPQRVSMVAWQETFQSLAKELQGLQSKEAELNADVMTCLEQVKGLEAAGDVVTAESVAGIREKRDGVWEGVRRAYVERSGDVQAIKKDLHLQQDLPEAYERQVKAADDQADLLRADTARATRYSELLARIQAMNGELAKLEKVKEELISKKAQSDADWAAILATLQLSYRTPEALLEWLVSYDKARTRAVDRDTAKAEQDSASRAIAEGHAVLTAGYAQAGLEVPALPTLASLTNHAHGQLKLATQRRNELVQLQKEKLRADRAIRAAEVELGKHRERASALLDAAKPDLDLVCLKVGASVEEIEARLQTISDLSTAIGTFKQSESKVKAARIAWDTFVTRMRELGAKLAREEAKRQEEWLSLAETMYSELKVARECQSRAEKLQLQIQTDTGTIAAETAKQKLLQASLNELVRLAKCEGIENLAEAIEASERRRRAEGALSELDEELSQYSQSERLGLLAAACSSEVAALHAALLEIQHALEELQPQIDAKRTAVADVRSQLAAIDGSAEALEAREHMEHYAATMQREAVNYARARLAQALLDNAVRSYQEKSQGPLIERASAWFSRMTQNRYPRLVVDHFNDEKVLTAEPTVGRRLQMSELSEGTADQLYLALRLAAIELRLDTSEAIPLILDDALLAFDDDRTIAALQALAELAKKNQTILFTHHQHVLQHARQNLKSEHFAIHELPPAKSFAAA